MTATDDPHRDTEQNAHRFWLLLIALTALLIGYPYFENTRTGAFLGGVRGDCIVEATFSAFYALTTVVIFVEVVKTRQVTSDTMYGAICVYLLVGMTFGSLYDLIETLYPGSFQVNVDTGGLMEIRWRTLIFFSFMTLTTIGLGDVTPVTTQAQSLVSIEGVMGVLYVAVLVAKVVGIYAQRTSGD